MEKSEVGSKTIVSKSIVRQRTNFFQVLIITFIIAFSTLTILVKVFQSFSFDLWITLTIQQFQPFWFDALMRSITALGNVALGGSVVIIALAITLLCNKYKDAILLTGNVVGAILLSETIKMLVSRVRPDPLLIHQVETFTRNDSFPSGHVMFEVSLYGFLLFLVYAQLKKVVWYRRALMIILSIPIVFVGLSRIYLGSHWFSDVLGAYMLAGIWLYFVIWIYRKWTHQT